MAVAVISAGAGNSYGHPTASVLARLKASGAKVYRTDLDGTVNIKTDGKSWQIETERDDGSKAAPTPAPTPTGGTGRTSRTNIFRFGQSKRQRQTNRGIK